MAVRVRLQPVSVRVAPGGGAAAFTVVHACRVQLTRLARGADPAAGPATLELFEVPRPRGTDVATTDRLIATLDGQFAMNGTTPEFTPAGIPTETALVAESDFLLGLEFNATTFPNATDVPISLPWETSDERDQLELGAQLTVGGTVHSTTAQNDRLDVPLRHNGVPEDGTGPTRLRCFGLQAVYPTGNALLTARQRIPVGTAALNIFLHENVHAKCDNLTANSFDLAVLTTHLRTILNDGGFATVNVTELTDAQFTAAPHPWRRRGGRFVANNIAAALATQLTNDASQAQIAATDGIDVPFFDYWVAYERNVTPQSAEAGDAEIMNPNAGSTFSIANVTKRLITPIALLAQGGGSFDSSYGSVTQAGDRMNFLADVITHELGHSLGLRHGLFFDASASTYATIGGTLLGAMTTFQIRGGAIGVHKFGPVHRDVIRTHFL